MNWWWEVHKTVEDVVTNQATSSFPNINLKFNIWHKFIKMWRKKLKIKGWKFLLGVGWMLPCHVVHSVVQVAKGSPTKELFSIWLILCEVSTVIYLDQS